MHQPNLVFDDLLNFSELSSQVIEIKSKNLNKSTKIESKLESEQQFVNYNIQGSSLNIKAEVMDNPVQEYSKIVIKSEPDDVSMTESNNIQRFSSQPIVLDSFSISQTEFLFFETKFSNIKQESQVTDEESLTESQKATEMDQQSQVSPNQSLKSKKREKSFNNKKKTTKDMKSQQNKIKCKICNSIMNPHSIYKHMRTVHPKTDEKFSCKICGKTFNNKMFLKNHELTHDKKFECKICKKKFPQSYLLKSHVSKMHENPNSFECKTCGKTFNIRNTLKNHEKTHDPNRIKPYKCGHCDYAFDESGNLKRHVRRKHTNVKK